MARRKGEDLECSRAGYRCSFVETPPFVLLQSECPICSRVLRNPYLTDCCGTSFCRTCIDGVQRDERACPVPTCQKPAFAVMRDKRVEKALRELIVVCENQVSGCEWKGALGNLDTHLERSCSFVNVTCKYNGCGTRGLREEMSAHEERCGRRPSRCEYCNEYESSFDGVSEHWRTCPKHPAAQCPNQIADALSKLLERMTVLETKVDEHETKMAEHAQLLNFGATMDQRMQALEAKVSDQKQILSEAQSTHLRQLLEEKLCEQRNNGPETMYVEQKATELRARGIETGMETERTKAFEQFDIKMEEFRKEMKKDMEKHALDVAEMSRSILTSLLFKVSKLPVPPLKMEFAQPHKVTKLGKSVLPNSERTFYSHVGGFRLHANLEVDDVNDKGDFFSKYNILLRVTCGEFDDCLQWPFEGTLVLSVKKDREVKQHFIDFREAPLECKSRVLSDKIQSQAWMKEIIKVKHPSPQLEFTIQNVKFAEAI